jgi:cell division protein DivIC
MKKFEKILPWLKDKYVLSIIVFLVWMTFFDRNDFISQYSYKQELNKLEVDKEYYMMQVEENKESIYELMSDPANLEKFAREKYHMKKDDEDVFLIIRASTGSANDPSTDASTSSATGDQDSEKLANS